MPKRPTMKNAEVLIEIPYRNQLEVRHISLNANPNSPITTR